MGDVTGTGALRRVPQGRALAEAAVTIDGVLTDLAEVAGRLPVPAADAEATARILDRLAEETAEVAGLVRADTAATAAGGGR